MKLVGLGEKTVKTELELPDDIIKRLRSEEAKYLLSPDEPPESGWTTKLARFLFECKRKGYKVVLIEDPI